MIHAESPAIAPTVDHVDLTALRTGAMRQLLWLTLLASWSTAVLLGETTYTRLSTWLPAVFLLSGTILGYGLQRHWYAGATLALLGSNTAALLIALILYPGTPAVYGLPLLVFAAGLLCGVRMSLGAAVLIGILLLTPLREMFFISPSTAIAVALLVVGSTVLTFVATRPLYTALHWSWNNYLQALRVAEELRNRQGELQRTLKELNTACYRLEVANHELQRARQAAEEARRLKAEFAASISHELRTPLNLIIGFSEVMLMAPHTYGKEPLPAIYRGDIEAIYRNARHLSNLIDDILDLSQIDAHRLGLQKEKVLLQEIVTEAVAAVQALFANKGLTLTLDIPADLPPLYADRTRIRQVLINLLNNAVRFTDTGGVTITAQRAEHEITVCVRDTGIGIAPDDLPYIFEEFRQADSSIRRRYGGSGLGLAICKRFIEMHGGTIWAESTPGAGSAFYFTLPLIENVAALPARPGWETWVRLQPDTRQPRVALLTERPEVASLFQRHLDGYHLCPMTSPTALQARAQEEPYQAIIVAQPAPVPANPEPLLQGAALGGNPPVLLCPVAGLGSAAARLQVAEFLVKPILRDRLLATLHRVAPRARTVLIVDDDPEMVRLLQRMLHSATPPYRTWCAYTGDEALRAMRRRRPDIVLLDLLLPPTDGYDVLAHMRADERLRQIPVVVITAKAGEAETVTAPMVVVSRLRGGLTVADLMGCLRATLDALVRPAAPDNAPASAAAPAG